MILRVVLLLVLLAAAGSWLYFFVETPEPGYVLIAFEGFRFESSLWFTLALLVSLWLLWRLSWWLVSLLGASGRVINPWSRRNNQRRVQQAAEQGMLDLAEGRWARALRHLQRAAEGEARPLMHYLGAARAAHKLGQVEESERLLERALERQPKAELAIALAHAEMQQSRGELQGALETLEVMAKRHPLHRQVLRHLLQVQQQRGDWSALLGLLPELRKAKVLAAEELDRLELQVWQGRLRAAGSEGLATRDSQALQRTWQQLSKAQREQAELVVVYAEQLQQLGGEAEAEEALRAVLKRGFRRDLLGLFGSLRGRDPARQLQLAEGWLKDNPGDAALLLCLGRLCLQCQLWGKAREYFESSLSFARTAETCAELGRLLTHLGETERSNQLLQESVELLEQHLPALPMPVQHG